MEIVEVTGYQIPTHKNISSLLHQGCSAFSPPATFRARRRRRARHILRPKGAPARHAVVPTHTPRVRLAPDSSSRARGGHEDDIGSRLRVSRRPGRATRPLCGNRLIPIMESAVREHGRLNQGSAGSDQPSSERNCGRRQRGLTLQQTRRSVA